MTEGIKYKYGMLHWIRDLVNDLYNAYEKCSEGVTLEMILEKWTKIFSDDNYGHPISG